MDTASKGNNLIEQVALGRAKARTNVERWSPYVFVLAVSILIITNVLIYTNVNMAVVGAVTMAGLIAVWIMGWLQGRRLFKLAYNEELLKLQQEIAKLQHEGRPADEPVGVSPAALGRAI